MPTDQSSIDNMETPTATGAAETPAAAETPPAGEAPGAEELAALKQERDALYDRLLRTAAEFDNYRKRLERERRDQGNQAVIDLLLDLLPVVDDLDRALEVEAAVGEDPDAYRKGVELIRTKLGDFLKKQGVRPIEALGADFNPNLHQAVLHEASPEHREGEVIGELQRGYLMGDRLLRPAMVKVAKA